jgi:hypothetical protein
LTSKAVCRFNDPQEGGRLAGKASQKTDQERKKLLARDKRLQKGLIQGDRKLTEEAFALLRRDLFKITANRERWMLRQHLEDVRQGAYALILRWQKEDQKLKKKDRRLREYESLLHLARRVWDQVTEPLKNEWQRAKEHSSSLNAEPTLDQPGGQDALEGQAEGSLYAPRGFANPERQAGAVRVVRWIQQTAQELSEDDRSVLRAVVEVELGEHETLGGALGVAEGAARMRKQRLRERLAALAVTEGNRELARRLAGTKYADGLELLHKAKREDAHRMQELKLYREGELPMVQKVALEKHLKRCPGCRRTLRAMTPEEDRAEDQED